MRSFLRAGSVAALAAALAATAAPAQGRKPKPDRDAPKPVKDDATTAKDPAIVAIDNFRKAKISTKRADWKSSLPAPPAEVPFAADRDYFWHVETDQGLLVIRLDPEAAPRHVASTIHLARAGFYDGLTFPRILKGFMAQGGSPTNTTSGNAGYTLDHEFADDRKHDAPGVLSAANAGKPNTDGSQFFLTFVPTPHLDGKHTVYGRVVEGLDTLQAIEACGVEKDGDPLPRTPSIVRTWIRVAPKPEDEGAGPGKDRDKDKGK